MSDRKEMANLEHNYVVYHLHSSMSNGVTNIDSVTKYNQYIEYAYSLGMRAIGFSEHGSIFGHIKKKECIEKMGMKYIHGEEFYVTESLFDDEEKKIKDNYHVVLMAKNWDGFLELNRLSSLAFNRSNVFTVGTEEHYYYAPRITFDELIGISDNIICSTACLGGILNKGKDDLQKRFIEFLKAHKDSCFLEIQHHKNLSQAEYNKKLWKISKETGIKLIAGTDTHCLDKRHEKGRLILQKAKNIHFSDEEGWDLTFKTYDELCKAYEIQNALPREVYLEAIENTNLLIKMIVPWNIDRTYKYPHLWENPEKLFKEKINKGFKKRGCDKLPNRDEYKNRVLYEYETYKKNGMVEFMLLATDFIEYCDEHNIQVGYGRGSVNGSLIAWLLGITEMDSVKHKLNFERFASPDRQSLADVDTDLPSNRRDEVKQYLFNREGLHCCDIITFNTIALRGAIRDVARALEIPLDEVSRICDLAEEDRDKAKELYPELMEYVDIVEGTIVSIGTHPCGCVVSDLNIEETFGLCTTSNSNYPVSQIYMKEIDSLNYVKLDLLCLDTIQLINDTCKLIGIPRYTPDNINANDDKVWDSIVEDTTMIFQWESDSAQSYIKRVMSDDTINKFKDEGYNVDKMMLFTIGNGAIRPAGSSYRDDLASGLVKKTGCKAIDDAMSSTFGYCVFQCQIIEFLHKCCGFTMGEADIVRRCVDEDTLITLSSGKRKKIKDIKIGDNIMSLNETGFIEYNRVSDVYDNGLSNVLKVETTHEYSLTATESHKVLTINGWTPISDLKVGDYIMTPSAAYGENDKHISSERLSMTDMFLIGMLIGDGCIINEQDIHFTNSDIVLIEKFKECVRNRLRIKREPDFSIYSQPGKEVEKIYSINIKKGAHLESVKNLLKSRDLLHKASDKYIPEELMMYPVGDKLLSLLGGLFSTDGGYVTKAKAIEYYTISKELAEDVKWLLLKCGIYSYVYSAYVGGKYNYNSYKVRISQYTSLIKFKDIVLPYIVGNKKSEFENIIERNTNTDNAYDYLIPPECVQEIRDNSNNTHTSLNGINITGVLHSGLSNKKAERIVDKIYCPTTYALLRSGYIPVKITNIVSVGERHVYDLCVENTHNYVANDIIVHNCFAKKLGTEQHIPTIINGGYINDNKTHYIKGFVQTMEEEYGYDRKYSTVIIADFIKVIEDASEYLFSINHSEPYSYEGYVSGYLRYYYPVEFLTCALNINTDNPEKTTKIAEYAKKRNISLYSPKFRYSSDKYVPDKENNAIYKGIASIKNLNAESGKKLYNLKDQTFNSFLDFLKINPCNSRQTEILIKLDFFSEFGKSGKLMQIFNFYQTRFDKDKFKKQIKKDKNPYPVEIVSKYSKETEKQYNIQDVEGFCTEIIAAFEDKDLPITERLKAQTEYLGYIEYKNPKAKGYGFITEINTQYAPKLSIYLIDTGEIITVKMPRIDYEMSDLKPEQVIKFTTYPKNKKKKVNDDWVALEETEPWMKTYKIF